MASGENNESWRSDKFFANNRRDDGRNKKAGGRDKFYDDNGEWINDGRAMTVEAKQSQLDLKLRAATLQYNLPEDMRISKLLRRLCGENDPKVAIDLCEKLKMVLLDKANAAYIHRSFDSLADLMVSVIEKGPFECLCHAAEAFGLLGYVVRDDFPKYKAWIVKMYKKAKSLKVHMMRALGETLKQDSNTLDLRDHSSRLMELLKDFLEAVDVPEIFLAIIDVIVVICRNYPKNFEPYFTDIVDIVVGWHLEAEQSVETKYHISKVLQEFNPFWEKDLKFTLNLLTLFLEDITACGDEIANKADDDGGIEDGDRNASPPFLDKSVLPEFCFGSFVGAFNTVLKCLASTGGSIEAVVTFAGKTFLEESFVKIMQVACVALEKSHSEEIVIPVNEYCCLLVECQKSEVQIQIDEYIRLLRIELINHQHYTTKQVLSFLMLVLKTVYQYKGNLPLEFVGMLFSPDSEFLKIRFWKNERVHRGLIKVYHEILNIKNVSLLQETYKHILRDIEKALRSLVGMDSIADALSQQEEAVSSAPYTELQAEIALNFSFSVLSALATTNNSIMAMWALQPSLLELLAHQMRLANIALWHQRYQVLHFALLKLLSAHCMINNNFITSSNLLNTKNSKMAEVFNKLSMLSSSQSPTSEHFGLILSFLCETLKSGKEMVHIRADNAATVMILLDWCNDLFGHIAQYAEILKAKPEFTAIVRRINFIAITAAHSPKVTLKCATCLETLLSSFDTLHDDCYTTMAETCCVQMCSNSFEFREKFSFLFSMLPLKFSLKQANEFTGRNEQRAAQIGQLQTWHVASDKTTMRPQYFKAFVDRIQFSKDAEHIEEYLKEIFTKCWLIDPLAPKSAQYFEMAKRDIRCLISWMQTEAAQYCVNNKLRTPIGKPQDTFLKIESILKEDARILALKEKTTVKNYKTLIANYKQSRVLLGFLEALEKAIYNAYEGTAFAMPPVENPAKTFFKINSSTCHEWFNRIRGAVDLVALHGMEAEMVIRYSQNVLREMSEAGRTNDPIFENTLRSLCWALVRSGESDSIYGLYVWIKAITNNNRKYCWIKMAALQAAGHRELAINGYLMILANAEAEDTADDKLDPFTREFIVDMSTESLMFTFQWPELRQLLQQEESRTIPRVTTPIMTLTSPQIDCIIKFEETRDINVFDLSNWEMLDKGPHIPSNFSCHRMISLVENTLGNILLGQDPFPVDTSRYIFRIIHSLLHEALRTRSTEYLNQLTILNHICHKAILCKLKDRSAGNSNIESFVVDKSYGSFTLYRILFWSEYFDEYTNEGEQQITDIRLDIVSMARKETNHKMCRRELEKFYQVGNYGEKLQMEGGRTSVDDVRGHLLVNATQNVDVWDVNLSRAVYEQCKWMYATSLSANDQLAYAKEEAIQLAAAATAGICQRITKGVDNVEMDSLKEKAARYLLKLSEWLQCEHETLITDDLDSPLTRLITGLPDVRPPFASPAIAAFIPIRDAAVGKLLQNSCEQFPELAKVWGAFGAWCYRWGKKMVELKADSGAATVKSGDITEIRKILGGVANDADIDRIVEILNEHQITEEDEEVICDTSSSTVLIESQLRSSVACLAQETDSNLEAIVKIWKQSRRNIYSYYEMSAAAYFRYLKLATASYVDPKADEQHDSSMITAALRILRLIVKHALGLQEVLEEGLASTPTTPWKIIIPQLFSRLNHPEPYVRRRVSELLCRVAADSPHLIIFPTVVGAVAQEKRLDIALNNSATGNFDLENCPANDSSGLICGFQSLLDTLSHQSPETVKQVKVLVHELKRIALLWDDLWLVSLTQIYIECSKKFKLFFEGATAIDEHQKSKIDVASEKYRIVLLPVIFVMEKLHEVTSRKAETNYEKAFQDKYSKFIEETIVEMKTPSNVEKLTEGWQRFKTLFGRLKQQAHKRPQYTLKLTDISPVLAQLSNTSISMPGVDNKADASGEIFIKSIDNLVHILPTKTKPKKMIFYGSDGRQYTFLFKGLEDLHLDERIMQFLSIANLMMTKSMNCNGAVSFYRAKHYSVIPLGPRSGLISWVDNVTPLFNLYKKWQQREASNPKRDKNYAVLRTSEIFYNKLTPLLAEHNMKVTDNRKDWPIAVLRRVLQELTNETPRDLLAKELWCQSTTAAVWRKAVRNYSLSLAVMSVIGYIIGLGDRHLSNILVNLSTGEVVHIDYNVCFEKGKTLAVPEKVPFRMTPNLETALGVTGVEGTFRLACEHVLKSLKKGRETLLTLLEAFVYDPLVDWAVGEDGLVVTAYAGVEAICIGELRQAKKQLEREVNRDTLVVRFAEIKPDWLQNRDDLCQQLLQMQNYLQKLENQRRDIQLAENQRDLLSKQLIMVQQAAALGSAIRSHQLNTLSQRYATYRLARNEYELIEKQLKDKSQEAKKFIDDYLTCMRDINNDKLIEYIGELQDDHGPEKLVSEYELVKEFLENSAQLQTYRLGDETRRELHNSASQQVAVVRGAFELLIQYGGIACHFTADYQLAHHRLTQLRNGLQHMIESQSGIGARELVMQLTSGGHAQVQSIEHFALFACHLKKTLEAMSYHLQENCEKLKCELEQPQQMQFKSPILMYESAKSTIEAFAANEDDALAILEVVSLSFLTDLNQKYLDAEKYAAQATEPDLMLNRKWFVDELHLQTTSLSDLLDVLLKDNGIVSPIYAKGLHTLAATSEIYGHLSEIFRTIQSNVLPSVLKGIVCDDRSVLDMIAAVSNLQQNLLPLDELLAKMTENLTAHVQGRDVSPHPTILGMVSGLKKKFLEMSETMLTEQPGSLGQQIFTQFQQMFEQLESAQNHLIVTVDENNKIVSKTTWQRIDQIIEARALMTTFTDPTQRHQYLDIFLVRRLEAMIDFFTGCLQMACAFKGKGDRLPDNHFVRTTDSFKKLLADYVRHMVLGIGPQYFALTIGGILENVAAQSADVAIAEIGGGDMVSLFELCHQVYEIVVKRNDLSVHGITQSTYHCGALKEAWWRKENVIYWENTIKLQTIEIQRIHQLLSAFYWINEDLIVQNQQHQMMQLCPIGRESMLMQLRNAVQSLSGWKATIQKIREELQSISVAVIQRLKWAAGANPGLVELQTAFEQLTLAKREKIDKECLLAAVALKYCISTLNFELLRIKSVDSTKLDADFVALAARWDKACQAYKTCVTIIAPVEKALVELLDPEGPINDNWLKNVSDLLDDMTDHAQQEISRCEKDITVSQDYLQMSAHMLRDTVAKHHGLANHVKTLLKSTQKVEDTMTDQIKSYLSRYKEFMDTIAELNGNVLSQDFTESVVRQTLAQLADVLDRMSDMFEDLFVFEKWLKERPEAAPIRSSPLDKRVSEMMTAAATEKETPEVVMSPQRKRAQTQKEQKLNAYAVSVGRRIRMKLEGRDLDPNKKRTVQEQIDWILREAMDLDNLAVLYEGWSPWV